MKRILLAACLAASNLLSAVIPDTVLVRPMGRADGSGLFLQWSTDGSQWHEATQGRILASDFGPWGREKKMYHPSMAQGKEGVIALVFQLNDHVPQFGIASTRDFIRWRPQDYPFMPGVKECLEPRITFHGNSYAVTFHDKQGVCYQTTTEDLVRFTPPLVVASPMESSMLRVPYALVRGLRDNQKAFGVQAAREGELARDNAERFAGLDTVRAIVHVDASAPKAISDKLVGIFFEDINYSADGGLNAQLVQNGDFEYDPQDRLGDMRWNQTFAWSLQGEATLRTDQPGVSPNNAKAIVLHLTESQLGASYCNHGWDGMALRKDAKYNLSLYLMGGKVRVSLKDGDRVLSSTVLSGGKRWTKRKAVLKAVADCDQATLAIQPLEAGTLALDMVSLIPQDTYKGHGLRRDLAETLAALQPKFMRFPGGCVTHGDGLGNIYHWKETIGPLEDRKPLRNIWGYHQSRQLGFYEFFQFCEDMGMEPLPVLAAGVPCQNSGHGGCGQQGGIPMEEMPAYVQDVLDLIEWANGDVSTTWGRKRMEQGHKRPFNLKYIGIGNEDLISPTFEERYLMICRAVKEKYPEIKICGTAGPFYYGSDYDEGWRIANENRNLIDLMDEHYYVSPGWYIYNQDFYDKYDRHSAKVYLGEWAAHAPGRLSTMETALAEAIHFCGLERNGDIVEMTSYAPLLAKEGHTQWNPNLIYFTNTEVKPTVNYYAHRMWGQSQGTEYLPSRITTGERRPGVGERLAVSTVRNSHTGKVFLKLVNALPVAVDAHLDLGDLLPVERTCKGIILTGAYDSTTARPVEQEYRLSPDGSILLPAYSFTLIEL